MSIIRDIQKNVPDCTYRVDTSFGYLKNFIKEFDVDLDPDYQRDFVWNENQQSKFVGAFIENPLAIPIFWFNWTNNRKTCELVDGKQRINACLKWLDGEIIAKCPCGVDVWHKDLDEVSIRNIKMSITLKCSFVELSKQEVMKFYLRLNSGGTVHTSDDLDKVRNMISE